LNSGQASKRNRRGFTLIEVAVATAILAIGVAMGMGALSAMTTTESRVRQVEKMNMLAVQKLHEVLAVGSVSTQQTDGTFEDYGESNFKWTMEVAPSGTENLETVRITVETTANLSSDPSAEVSGLVFTSPNVDNGALGG